MPAVIYSAQKNDQDPRHDNPTRELSSHVKTKRRRSAARRYWARSARRIPRSNCDLLSEWGHLLSLLVQRVRCATIQETYYRYCDPDWVYYFWGGCLMHKIQYILLVPGVYVTAAAFLFVQRL